MLSLIPSQTWPPELTILAGKKAIFPSVIFNAKLKKALKKLAQNQCCLFFFLSAKDKNKKMSGSGLSLNINIPVPVVALWTGAEAGKRLLLQRRNKLAPYLWSSPRCARNPVSSPVVSTKLVFPEKGVNIYRLLHLATTLKITPVFTLLNYQRCFPSTGPSCLTCKCCGKIGWCSSAHIQLFCTLLWPFGEPVKIFQKNWIC